MGPWILARRRMLGRARTARRRLVGRRPARHWVRRTFMALSCARKRPPRAGSGRAHLHVDPNRHRPRVSRIRPRPYKVAWAWGHKLREALRRHVLPREDDDSTDAAVYRAT